MPRAGSARTFASVGAWGALLLGAWLAPGGPSVAGAEAPAAPFPRFEYGVALETRARPEIDRLRVDKSERRLELISRGVVVAEYRVALGASPEGPKREEGDGRTPEGLYEIDGRKRDSDYHLALHVSYPNAEDRAQAEARGIDPGGAIMIHGLPNGLGFVGASHAMMDWTDGCIAVTNREIEEIWEWVRDGVPIEIEP